MAQWIETSPDAKGVAYVKWNLERGNKNKRCQIIACLNNI